MKIAIPIANGILAVHFGHCEKFAMIDVIEKTGEILKIELLTPPPHEPGLLPCWLDEKGVRIIIAGGMGQRAQSLFQSKGISVLVGAPCKDPEVIIKEYFNGTLETGVNACDH